MEKNIVVIFLIVIIIAGAGILYFNGKGNKSLPPSAFPTTATSATSQASPSLVAQVAYTCDDNKTIAAAFYGGEQKTVQPGQPPVPTGSVKIILSDGRSFDLPQTISADGGRYANSDESFVFWSKGDGAIVLEKGVEKDYKKCVTSETAAGCVNGKFTNLEGGYSFDCFPEWSFAITKKDAPQTDSLFGPGATETAGAGGVEIRNAKSIDDFLSSTGAAITDKRSITINGVAGVRDHYNGFPQKGEQMVFYKDGRIFNIYLGTDSRGSELSARDIGLFDRIVNSFKFISE